MRSYTAFDVGFARSVKRKQNRRPPARSDCESSATSDVA